MKPWIIAICLITVICAGCNAMDSLIFHPLGVVIKQHEYNERAKQIEQARTNSPSK